MGTAEELSIERMTKGEPERLLSARDPRILITGLHGDETLAARLAYHLYTEVPELGAHVDYICGNPEAAALGQRPDGEGDLNRVFYGPGPADARGARLRAWYRSRSIMRLIRHRDHAYVLDMHTSDTETEGFALISARNPVVDTIIGASALRHIAVMSPRMIENTLMGADPRAVAIEYARTAEGQDVEESVALIERLLSGAAGTVAQERQFFNVTRKITKAEDPGDVPNFELCADGYYPILLGKAKDAHSYRNSPGAMLCFAADTVEEVVL